jgi:hypothetical protein
LGGSPVRWVLLGILLGILILLVGRGITRLMTR